MREVLMFRSILLIISILMLVSCSGVEKDDREIALTQVDAYTSSVIGVEEAIKLSSFSQWVDLDELLSTYGEEAVIEGLNNLTDYEYSYKKCEAIFYLFMLRDRPEDRLEFFFQSAVNEPENFEGRGITHDYYNSRDILMNGLSGEDDVEYLPLIYEHLESNDPNMQEVSLLALGNFIDVDGVLDVLLVYKDSENSMLRSAVLDSLVRYTLNDEDAEENLSVKDAITGFLDDTEPEIRENAARGLEIYLDEDA
jgi:hypothetical protein